MRTKIHKIDRATCQRLRPLITNELAPLGERLGLDIEAENATFDPEGYVTFKVRCQLAGFDREKHEYLQNHYAVPGLEPEHYHTEFYYGVSRAAGGMEKWRLIGVAPRSTKYPIIAKKLVGQGAGKNYKLPHGAAQAILKEWSKVEPA